MSTDQSQKSATEINTFLALKGLPPAAIAYIVDVYKIIQIWDDLIDKDCDIEGNDVDTMMLRLMNLPTNPFYLENLMQLQPVMNSCFLQWMASREFEEKHEHLDMAYMLRAGFYTLIGHVYAIVFGVENAQAYIADVYRLYGETAKELENELCQVPQ